MLLILLAIVIVCRRGQHTILRAMQVTGSYDGRGISRQVTGSVVRLFRQWRSLEVRL